jgi:hypothetical protein
MKEIDSSEILTPMHKTSCRQKTVILIFLIMRTSDLILMLDRLFALQEYSFLLFLL